MKRSLLVGNWKMHGSLVDNEALLSAVSGFEVENSGVDLVVCVPFVYIDQAWRLLADSAVSVGAQDVSAYADGPYTGDVSASMLADVGAKYVIVGHSERRQLCAETDGLVAEKMLRALAVGISPIVCVGETLAERQAGETLTRITEQLEVVLSALPQKVAGQLVIAYEPLWAIGTGHAATVEQIVSVHKAIAATIAESGFVDEADTRILYGGSVKPFTAEAIFKAEGVDGALVGGASLSATDFLSIFNSLKRHSRVI